MFLTKEKVSENNFQNVMHLADCFTPLARFQSRTDKPKPHAPNKVQCGIILYNYGNALLRHTKVGSLRQAKQW